ncbi:hypothetical protein SAMN04487906_3293 [Zhouia amylolytica]|uniref:Uncharacterized protein n=2 Tax=Zhouia amylolytica TaxID=376730 RepID=W2UIE7_9FLAO|nr:hypothetical protein [Zhouia amylolytica]ETN93940.1 hypothetical protein P278_33510 [Zhouia amylolytica AD3]MCQ0112513.1 hypothetical protein [Zhouia amylolytica]SFT16164.1 hypothetical protein SAMN04487906_3293 [Zhouia amylolytica]
MCSKVFLVEDYHLDQTKSSVQINQINYPVYGQLVCSGEGHTVQVFFTDDAVSLPNGKYVPETGEGTIFIKVSEKEAYLELPKLNEPVYVYFNESHPELNCISINEPMRDQSFFNGNLAV